MRGCFVERHFGTGRVVDRIMRISVPSSCFYINPRAGASLLISRGNPFVRLFPLLFLPIALQASFSSFAPLTAASPEMVVSATKKGARVQRGNEKVMNGRVQCLGWFYSASNRRSWKFMLMLCDTDLCIISAACSDFALLRCRHVSRPFPCCVAFMQKRWG